MTNLLRGKPCEPSADILSAPELEGMNGITQTPLIIETVDAPGEPYLRTAAGRAWDASSQPSAAHRAHFGLLDGPQTVDASWTKDTAIRTADNTGFGIEEG